MVANFEILAHETSPLGLLCLRRRELLGAPGTFVTEITLNHEFLMSSLNTSSERALATLAVQMHDGSDLEVLVGGLGLGYTAQAALTTGRVAHVDVIEFLPQVKQWLADGLLPLSEELTKDSRLNVVEGDVYRWLMEAPRKRYDVIVIDVDHSPDERLDFETENAAPAARFYTEAGLERAKAHLTARGVLAVWSYDENPEFEAALDRVFVETRVERIEFENDLIDEVTTDVLFLARA